MNRSKGPMACRLCGIRLGLGSCSQCAIRAVREGGADGIANWAKRLQTYLNEGEAGRLLMEPERQRLRDWLNGWETQFPPDKF